MRVPRMAPRPVGRPVRRFGSQDASSSDPVAPGSRSDDKAASSASRAAADMGKAARGDAIPGSGDRAAVLITTCVTSSPTDRAASSSSGVASRKRALHTGESTRNTSCTPFTLASRACAASEGGKCGRNRWSSASSQRARRIGSAAEPVNSASSATRGPVGALGGGDPDGAPDERERDIA